MRWCIILLSVLVGVSITLHIVVMCQPDPLATLLERGQQEIKHMDYNICIKQIEDLESKLSEVKQQLRVLKGQTAQQNNKIHDLEQASIDRKILEERRYYMANEILITGSRLVRKGKEYYLEGEVTNQGSQTLTFVRCDVFLMSECEGLNTEKFWLDNYVLLFKHYPENKGRPRLMGDAPLKSHSSRKFKVHLTSVYAQALGMRGVAKAVGRLPLNVPIRIQVADIGFLENRGE